MAAPGVTYNNPKRVTDSGAEGEALAAHGERKVTFAKVFVAVVVLAASLVVGHAIFKGMPGENVQFVALLFLSVLAARMKLTLPGFDSCMSMNLPFILIAVAQLDVSQAVIVGAVSTLAQCMPSPGSHMKPLQMLFNVCNIANAIAISCLLAQHESNWPTASKPVVVAATALLFFVADTLPVATIIALTEGKDWVRTWDGIVLLSLPYFVLSAGVATIVLAGAQYVGWQLPSVLLVVMYCVYRSFRHYFNAVRKAWEPVKVKD
jgi:hypothetical protein